MLPHMASVDEDVRRYSSGGGARAQDARRGRQPRFCARTLVRRAPRRGAVRAGELGSRIQAMRSDDGMTCTGVIEPEVRVRGSCVALSRGRRCVHWHCLAGAMTLKLIVTMLVTFVLTAYVVFNSPFVLTGHNGRNLQLLCGSLWMP